MELKELVGELTEAKVKLQLAEAAKGTAEAQLAASNTERDALRQEVDTLKGQLNPEKEAEIATLKDNLTKAQAFLGEQAKLAATAAGLELKEEATLDEQLELLKAAQVKLGAIPRGGVTRGMGEQAELKDAPSMVGFIRS